MRLQRPQLVGLASAPWVCRPSLLNEPTGTCRGSSGYCRSWPARPKRAAHVRSSPASCHPSDRKRQREPGGATTATGERWRVSSLWSPAHRVGTSSGITQPAGLCHRQKSLFPVRRGSFSQDTRQVRADTFVM